MSKYVVNFEQTRKMKATIVGDNKRQAVLRAKELLEDGALDDGFGLPPDFLHQFKTKVISVKERK